MAGKTINIKLKIWRQAGQDKPGKFESYEVNDVSVDMSFLEMLDVLNENELKKGNDPVHFDHDCREGICGMCSLYINGKPHGPKHGITTCQLHMRTFKDGETIVVEPWRASAFPVLKDLMVDRTAFERIQQAGGYVTVSTGGVPDANEIPIPKTVADEAMDAAQCIGCGACVAACKNASAMLFTAAKVSQLAVLPQGKAERKRRALAMLEQHDAEGFGACTNTGACEAVCPKEISITHIARLNREFTRAAFSGSETDYTN
ncbi:succinate dehydrogenase/fumarate reductase iron-sulfur subunit [Flammeovirga sp. MY04]|nr:succinate dehydrogenase/fumarate reductase iron-sulfur subunit [Flammeovirga yaeyamensis]ANQ47649.1 succinate dehydrogenase/fumarate reductase iron-sulfur subunit [Flammeovirga sp. MY04]MBB3700105.1 succinate dehydrogenase / fumarate reductase iron-sulfur subunit [Flammeovirga yaeyamensis]NMF37264.1 succinate dehydrogenase/fumarate reductase iron-sulfur subunit [Flammeovirga yaeyamensis]